MNKLNRLIINESVESRPQSLMGWEGVGVGLTRLYPLSHHELSNITI